MFSIISDQTKWYIDKSKEINFINLQIEHDKTKIKNLLRVSEIDIPLESWEMQRVYKSNYVLDTKEYIIGWSPIRAAALYEQQKELDELRIKANIETKKINDKNEAKDDRREGFIS